MIDCKTLDRVAAPYVDGELEAADRTAVDAHLAVCPPCRARLDAERSVRELIHARQSSLCAGAAPSALCARCAAAASTGRRSARPSWRARLTPYALAATLVLIVGGAFLYQMTDRSARVLAAELTADHIKCFGINRVLGTHDTASAVESSVASTFGLHLGLPDRPEREGMELVGERPCLYGEGRVAHIMYRHNGQPVSLFMLPNTTRTGEIVEIMGHEADIWSAGGHTFVLITGEPRAATEHMASFVQASLR